MALFEDQIVCWAAILAVVAVNACGQTMTQSRNWLPASSGTDAITVTFSNLSPENYQLLVEGAIGIRWNGQILPSTMTSTAALEFTVPAALRLPGLTEFVLWDTNSSEPLPYRGWISVIIPSAAQVFEADSSSGRVVAAVGADGTGTGTGGLITVYSLSTGLPLHTVALMSNQRVLAFTPDTTYAWITQNESQGSLARLNLLTGQVDQPIQVKDGSPPYTLSGQVYRQDPSILIVSAAALASTVTRAYVNGSPLPNAAPAGSVVPLGMDDQGRVLVPRAQACGLDETNGFVNCVVLMPNAVNTFSSFTVVWKNKGVSEGIVYDLTTGDTLLTCYCIASYLPENNRLLFYNYGSMVIADGDTLESYASVGSEIPGGALGPQWILAPDWILMPTYSVIPATGEPVPAILIGQMPQLGPAPSFLLGGVVNSATSQPGPISAGEIVTIYGQNLGPAAASGPVPGPGLQFLTEVEETQVVFGGVAAAILYAGQDQINAVVPETVLGTDSVAMQILHYGIPSPPMQMQVASFSPGIFGYPTQGQTYAAAFNSDGVLEGPSAPLKRGTIASFYATGVGLPDGEPAAAVAASADPVAVSPTVTIGGVPAQVLYAGLSPGLTAGLTQLNVMIPANAPTGSAVEIAITAGAQTQGNVWVAVQ